MSAAKVINEIREITANEVAKKQDASKVKFPQLIDSIKLAASRGKSELILSQHEVNEFDKKLLENEGFGVYLIDKPRSPYDDYKYISTPTKVWKITW